MWDVLQDNWSGHFLKDFIYLILERGERREKEREKNTDVRKKYQLIASLTQGDPTCLQASALMRNQTGKLLLCKMRFTQLSHPGQGWSGLLKVFIQCHEKQQEVERLYLDWGRTKRQSYMPRVKLVQILDQNNANEYL